MLPFYFTILVFSLQMKRFILYISFYKWNSLVLFSNFVYSFYFYWFISISFCFLIYFIDFMTKYDVSFIIANVGFLTIYLHCFEKIVQHEHEVSHFTLSFIFIKEIYNFTVKVSKCGSICTREILIGSITRLIFNKYLYYSVLSVS